MMLKIVYRKIIIQDLIFTSIQIKVRIKSPMNTGTLKTYHKVDRLQQLTYKIGFSLLSV